MKGKNTAGSFIIQVIFFLFAASIIYPFLWMIMNSFKSNAEFFQSVWAFPKHLLWSNYTRAWNEAGLGTYFFNSLYLTAVGTFLTVLSSATSSYVVARFNFVGKNIVFFFAISSFLIPSIGSLAALYKFMINMHLYNSHLGLLVLYSGGLGFGFIILYGFFKTISWEYAEAAYIDGANDWQIFYKIMIPFAKPGISAIGLISSIGIWNDYFTPYIFLQDHELYTVSIGLYFLNLKQGYQADWVTLYAALTLATLPVFVVYMIFQDKLISGFTTSGGLKG
jgi:ABC-type glycerol-3-phosphate transport system permease component